MLHKVSMGQCPRTGCESYRTIAPINVCMRGSLQYDCFCFDCFCLTGHSCKQHDEPCAEGSGCLMDLFDYIRVLDSEFDYVARQYGLNLIKLWVLSVASDIPLIMIGSYEQLVNKINKKDLEIKDEINDHYAMKYAHDVVDDV